MVLFIALVGGFSARAQTPTYECWLMNDLQVSDSIYEFDIYMKSTGTTTLEVANFQVGLNFNGAIRNGGTLIFSLVSGTSEFNSTQRPSSFAVDTTLSILKIAPRANPGAGNGTIVSDSGKGTRFGRFRITNTVSFGTVTPDLSWNFLGVPKYPTKVSAYVNSLATDITNQSSYYVNLSNPILNMPISGKSFNDLNNNGVLDAGEPGLANWRIRLSQSATQIDSALTDSNGNYGFSNLSSGTYTVSEQLQTGWTQTSTPACYIINFTSGSFSINNNFGNDSTGGDLPIQLASFTATQTNGQEVQIEWTTVSETNTYGFYVERKEQNTTSFKTISDLIPGAGTTLEQHKYSLIDKDVNVGAYGYRLQQVDLNGVITYSRRITVVVSGALDVRRNEDSPRDLSLKQNYPNPFNPTTVITFTLPVASIVTLKVFNLLGKEVASLLDLQRMDGHYNRVVFNAQSLESGMYFYRLIAQTIPHDNETAERQRFVSVGKMLLLK